MPSAPSSLAKSSPAGRDSRAPLRAMSFTTRDYQPAHEAVSLGERIHQHPVIPARAGQKIGFEARA
jgi:hypothetical protein